MQDVMCRTALEKYQLIEEDGDRCFFNTTSCMTSTEAACCAVSVRFPKKAPYLYELTVRVPEHHPRRPEHFLLELK
jgi:hypothetical protein